MPRQLSEQIIFFLVMLFSLIFVLPPLTDVNRAQYSVGAGAVWGCQLLSEPIRVVDLLQLKYFNLKYSLLLQFESCLVMDIYY